MNKHDRRQLVIIGDGEFSEIAYEYFSIDSNYSVVGFAVEHAYREKETLRGLPVVDFEKLEDRFPPECCHVFVAVSFGNLNRVRARLFRKLKGTGYTCATYISSSAFVWDSGCLGENCFVFEDNTIQPFVKIGDNVILWSGNHVGHRAVIQDHCFISSHVVISGFCSVGENTFMGVNSTLADEVSVGKDNWIGPGVVLTKSTEDGVLFGATQADPARVSTHRFFKLKE